MISPKDFIEVAAGQKVVETIERLPVESQQRVLEKLRDQYFKKQPLTLSITPDEGNTRFPHVKTSDPGEISRAMRALDENMTDEERRTFRRSLHEQMQKRREEEREIADVQRRAAYMAQIETEYVAFLQGPMVLERPQQSLHHQWHAAFHAGPNKMMSVDEPGLEALQLHSPWNTTAFVIEHDWAAAFAHASDFEGGDYKLPYDCTLFEFRVSGHPVLAAVKEHASVLFVRVRDYWLGGLMTARPDALGLRLLDLVSSQIRAVCIALDAEVAIKETIRAPEKLNRARAKKGKPPLKDYHVVRLHRRPRAAPLERDPNAEPSHHKRLHFVRGHWRHYEDHKTWIKWHLRGDPDLGFIEKHYRL